MGMLSWQPSKLWNVAHIKRIDSTTRNGCLALARRDAKVPSTQLTGQRHRLWLTQPIAGSHSNIIQALEISMSRSANMVYQCRGDMVHSTHSTYHHCL
jgi:hypothetical protein